MTATASPADTPPIEGWDAREAEMGINPNDIINSITPPAMRELGRTIAGDAEAEIELARIRSGETDSSALLCHLVVPHVVNAVYKHGCLDEPRLMYLYEVLVEHALMAIAAGHDWEHISKRASGWAHKLVYQRHSSIDGLTDVPSVTEDGDNRSYRTSMHLVGTEFDAEVHDAALAGASQEFEEAVDEEALIERVCENIAGRRVEQRKQQRVVILTMLAQGYTQIEVARMAGVTDRTVRNEVVAAQDAVLDWATNNRRLRAAA